MKGSVIYRTAETVKPYVSPQETPCVFWFEEAQYAQSGRVWMQFLCPVIQDPGTNTQCALGISTVAVENCDS